MGYIATRTLNTKRRLIRKGEKVPASYPLLKVALKRGWVIEESNLKPVPVEPAAPAPEPPPAFQMHGVTILEPELIPEKPVKPEAEEIEPAIEEVPEPESEVGAPLNDQPVEGESLPITELYNDPAFSDSASIPEPNPSLIADFDFLSNRNISKLTQEGIINVSDLEGWTVDQLTDIRGIGASKANQLLDERDKYEKSK